MSERPQWSAKFLAQHINYALTNIPSLILLQIVASLLLYMEEEEVFWLTCTIIEDMLPSSYFSSSLLGVQADQRVLSQLIASYLPDLDNTLKKHDVGRYMWSCNNGQHGIFSWMKHELIWMLTDVCLISFVIKLSKIAQIAHSYKIKIIIGTFICRFSHLKHVL